MQLHLLLCGDTTASYCRQAHILAKGERKMTNWKAVAAGLGGQHWCLCLGRARREEGAGGQRRSEDSEHAPHFLYTSLRLLELFLLTNYNLH